MTLSGNECSVWLSCLHTNGIHCTHHYLVLPHPQSTRIHLSDIQQPSDGVGAFFTTFVAKKRPFYLHQELMRESNTELYMRLLGMSSKKIEEENARTIARYISLI